MKGKYWISRVICFILIFLIAGCAGGPNILPQERIAYNVAIEALEKAEHEIKLAKEEGADELMPNEFNKARGIFATAESKLNEKKFSEARELSEKARSQAKLARELPNDARNTIKSAGSIIQTARNSELSKLFPDLIKSAERDLSEATKCLGKKDFVMAKVYAGKIINELGLKKDKFENAIKLIKDAENNINAAKSAEVNKFLPDEFNNAEDYFKKAKSSLDNKDFDSAKSNAESSSKISKNSKDKVPDVKRNLETTIKNNISESRNILERAKQEGAEQYALELLKIAESSISNADSLFIQKKLQEANEASKKAKSDAESVVNKVSEEKERIKTEEEAKKKAEEETKIKAEEEKKKAEDEAKIKAEEDAKKKAEEKAKKKTKKKKSTKKK